MKKLTILTFIIFVTSISFAQSVIVKNSSAETLLEVNDEGTDGASLTIISGSEPTSGTTDKLYNEGGTLMWNNNALGTGGSSLWTQNGSDIYYNTGKVGIGTIAPSTKLHIYGTEAGWGVEEELIRFELAGTYGGTMFVQYANNGSDWGLKIRDFNDVDHFTINYGTGNVGIGTIAPSVETQVHIENQTNDNFGVLVDATGTSGSEIGLHTATSQYASLVKNAYYSGGRWNRFNDTSGAFLLQVVPTGDTQLKVASANTGFISWTTGMCIKTDGNVGIQTTDPGAGLDVNSDVILGANGTRFMEIVEISDMTGIGSHTEYADKLPTSWIGEKTCLLSLEIQYAADNGNWYSVGYNDGTNVVSYSLEHDGRDFWIYYPNELYWHGRNWRAIIMRMP